MHNAPKNRPQASGLPWKIYKSYEETIQRDALQFHTVKKAMSQSNHKHN